MMKKIGIAVCLAAVLSVVVAEARAFEYEVSPSSYFFFSNDRNVNVDNDFYFPLYQYLNVGVTKLGADSLSLYVSGWGRGDFTSRGGDRADGELLYGYLQWKDPSSPRRVLRAGRQFSLGGAASLVSHYVDGVYFKSDIAANWGVEIIGGSPVLSAIDGRGGDFVGQGRAYKVWEGKAEVGASYLNERDSGARSREYAGVDFWIHPFKKVDVNGSFFYDIIGKEPASGSLIVAWLPVQKLKVTGDFGYFMPVTLLSRTSIFSVFSSSNYEKTGVSASWFATDRFTLNSRFHFFHYSDGGNVVRLGSDGILNYGKEKRGTASLGVWRLDQLEGGVTEVRAWNKYRLGKKWTLSGDVYAFILDEAILNRSYSFTTIGNVSFEAIKNLVLTGSAFYSNNPYFNSEVKGLFKVDYFFGGKTDVL